MSRKMCGIAVLAAAGLLASGCVIKDPKFGTASIPDAAEAQDAMILIGTDGDTTVLNAPPNLCSDPRFGRSGGGRSAGAVTIPCWDGS